MDKLNKWLESRPFLNELGAMHLLMEQALADCDVAIEPNWAIVNEAFAKDEPLISAGFIELDKAAGCLEALATLHDETKWGSTTLPAEFKEQCKELDTQLKLEPSLAAKLVKNEAEAGGIAVLFVQLAVRKLLQAHQARLTEVLDEAGWQESYCPTCGAQPTLAQLKKTKSGRVRYLVCSSCHSKWHYKRIGCPYCGDSEQEHMSILEAEEESELRLDICNSCNNYLKTYVDEGMEDIALQDWASLHMDFAYDTHHEKQA
jgi:FdhE protein